LAGAACGLAFGVAFEVTTRLVTGGNAADTVALDVDVDSRAAGGPSTSSEASAIFPDSVASAVPPHPKTTLAKPMKQPESPPDAPSK